ncbi:MAG: classes I and II aminotransferase [Parvularcula sp.]|uniref:pyridoxal phosphate-dependent aminotransferase n=1 Tax=Hyphococcus sp. TaxID=2038636 RepID=UPI000C37FED5|nr:classes I and II aminotransferase [Parvularcula sp.]
MTIQLSRRLILTGAAGATLAGTARAAAVKKEEAFPPEVLAHEHALLGPDEGVALLARNENPYGPSESALRMVEYAGKKGAYYPGQANITLAEMIAERHGVDPKQIVITTGSGEALSAIAVLYGPKGPIVAPRLFWDTTALYATRLGMAEITRVPLKEDMSVDLAGIEAAVTEDTGLVQLCNPNNPTGLVSDSKTFKAAVKRMAKKTTVLVDEAYMELADDPDTNTCVDLVKKGDDVIVSRTFSKIYGMAGLRVGYTISSEETAEKIRGAAMSWIAGTGLASAIGAYNDHKFLDYSKSKILEARQMVLDKTAELGMEALPSQTNFVYFKSGKPANDIHELMKAKNILVRGQYMDYADWTRVSMGKIEDVERFCAYLPEAASA